MPRAPRSATSIRRTLRATAVPVSKSLSA
jgi:hypothetical protein